MAAPAPDVALVRLSTRDMPEKERVEYWREVFGRHVIRIDFTPKSDAPFEAEASLWAVPGLRAHRSRYKGAAQLQRTRGLISQTDESVALLIDRKGSLGWSQHGAEIQLARSSAVLVLHAEPAEMIFPSADYMAIMAGHCAAHGRRRGSIAPLHSGRHGSARVAPGLPSYAARFVRSACHRTISDLRL